MIRAIALDDEPLALDILETFCSQMNEISLEKTFTNPSDALKYLRKFPTDLIFLDIQMPSVSGIDFYKNIAQNTMVIFTTAHSQYAVESYNLNAIDYLLKPFEYSRFQKAVNKANEARRLSNSATQDVENAIFLRSDFTLVKVATGDILFIESMKDYLTITCVDGRTIVTRMTMKAMIDMLPTGYFVRIHRSYIVPISQLREIRNKKIRIGEAIIPIGERFEKDLRKYF